MTLTQINKAGLDELALDHVFTIGASGSSAYTFQGEGLNGTVNNPTLYLTRGKTYRFENGSGGHPIRIQSTSGASGTAYNTGVTNNAGSGTVIVEVQHDAPDILYYQCTSHAAMNGILYITGALADGGVTTAKLAAGSVQESKIATGAVTESKINDGAVTQNKIGNSAIVAGKIADDAVADNKLSDHASDDSLRAVGTNHIKTNAVTTAKILDANVTSAKIASGAITNTKIAQNAVGTLSIAADAITNVLIADNAVQTANIANTQITTAKIADDAVTTAKIADDAIRTAKIVDANVTDAKIASGISSSKLTGALPAIDGSALTGLAAFPSGTKMIFNQTSAPTGWTKTTSGVNNVALRVVTGTVGSGGSNGFTNVFNSSVSTSGGAVANHTLTLAEIPSHNHGITAGSGGGVASVRGWSNNDLPRSTQNAGGGGAHNHGFTNPSFNVNVAYVDVIVATKD